MSMPKRAAVKVVRLSPVPGVFVNGEPAVEREVSPEKAEELLSYWPAAFTKTPSATPDVSPKRVKKLATFTKTPPAEATTDADTEPQE